MLKIELHAPTLLNADLYKNLLEMLKLPAVSLTHKTEDFESIITGIEIISKIAPEAEITQNLSMKYIKGEHELFNLVERAKEAGVRNFLVISGTPKKHFDSIAALKFLSKDSDIKLSCAYTISRNTEEPEREWLRLEQKFDRVNIENVYFQITDQVKEIQLANLMIRNIFGTNITCTQSVLIPTPSLLTTLKKKLWSGVSLESQYLENLQYAREKTQEIVDGCNTAGIDILFECFEIEHFNEYESFIRNCKKD